MYRSTKLLWIDCIGGLIVGSLILVFSSTIATWHNLPRALIVAMAVANLLYGSFSLSLATRRQPGILPIRILAIANIGWLFVCCLLTALWRADISVLGVLHLTGEGLYVAALGMLEWRWQKVLANV